MRAGAPGCGGRSTAGSSDGCKEFDIDMIGGHIEDAFSRLDFLTGHKQDTDAVRQRLLEYFAIPEAGDDRVMECVRLSALMY